MLESPQGVCFRHPSPAAIPQFAVLRVRVRPKSGLTLNQFELGSKLGSNQPDEIRALGFIRI